MSEINAPEMIAPAIPLATEAAEVASVAEVAAELAQGKPIDPAQVVEAVVTTESLFDELIAAVSRDARGISHQLENVLARSKLHRGL